MALRAILDKLDDVSEAQRSLYVQRDGKFVLDVDQDSAEEAYAAGLKRNKADLLRDLAAAKKKLENYDGTDPEEYKRLKAAEQDAELKRAEKAGEWDKMKSQLIENHTKELESYKAQLAKRDKALRKHLADAKLTEALAQAKAKGTMLNLLALDGRGSLDIRETDDDFEAFVSDGKGNPLIADGKGTPMTIKDLVEQQLKTKYPDAFEGTGSSGSGASRSTGGASGGSSTAITDAGSFMANLKEIAGTPAG